MDADSFLLDVVVLEFRGRSMDQASVVLATEDEFVAEETSGAEGRRCWLSLRVDEAGVSKPVGEESVVAWLEFRLLCFKSIVCRNLTWLQLVIGRCFWKLHS